MDRLSTSTMSYHKTMRRTRSLTVLGTLQFEQSVNKYESKLRDVKRNIDSLIADIDDNPVMDLGRVKRSKADLTMLMSKYDKVSKEYVAYLKSQRTGDSEREESAHRLIASKVREKVSATLEQLDSVLPKSESNKSVRTRSSASSSRLTSVMLKHAARVEEARTRLKYAEAEAELMRKEVALKADRTVLNVKREFDAAQSGLTAIKKVLEFPPEAGDEYESYEPPMDNSDHSIHYTDEQEPNLKSTFARKNASPVKIKTATSDRTENFVRQQSVHTKVNSRSDDRIEGQHDITHNLNPDAPTYVPTVSSDAQELAKLLAKKQLLPARLTSFDDVPGHYVSWKSSFENVMSELGASPLEQLDLLIQNLGPKSKFQAVNIRCANPGEPTRALRLIWERMDSRFGSPENIEASLKDRVASFQVLRNSDRAELFELADLATEIESIMRDERYRTLFAYYDSSTGVNPIVRKLPHSIQEKWTYEANKYKERNRSPYPPFSFFVSFLQSIARVRNDPSFVYDHIQGSETTTVGELTRQKGTSKGRGSLQLTSKKTEVESEAGSIVCPIHGTNHTLNMCRRFRAKPLSERRDYLRQNGYCFRCCGPKKHLRKKCKETVKCEVCKSSDHPSALHQDPDTTPQKPHEEESVNMEVKNACTQICNTPKDTSKSCAKIVLVKVYPHDQRHRARELYCIIDDQSNKSLAVSEFFDAFGEKGEELEYVLSSCAGRFTTTGRRTSGYVVEAIDGSHALNLPDLIECNDIPANRDEIPSPVVAAKFSHLRDIASHIPYINDQANIELLIGRDLITAHHVLDQRVGMDGLPYGQQLPLGWVVIGDVCLGKIHGPQLVSVKKTAVLSNGRPTLMKPCESEISVKVDPVFKKTVRDERPGLSIDDQRFLDIMDSGFQKTEGHWTAPLPFRTNRPLLPNNKPAALRRAKSFDVSLMLNPTKRKHVLTFMQKLFNNQHAELAPEMPEGKEHWYLPMFGVYHPKKPESIRIVFDSSAKFHEISLNDVLLKGPDLCNSLLGILLRFRREAVAVTMDIEQMFHNFKVSDGHRDFLRFLWHEGNDLERPLVDYRMTVHVFGNSPSPAVAAYGLRKTVDSAAADVKDLVINNFYVDDGLLSCAGEDEAIDLVNRTKQSLHDGGNLRLHKFASNSRKVLNSFDPCDLAKNLKDLNLGAASLPMQRSLGLLWDTESDVFTFSVSSEGKPYTRRGVLSTVNSLYDPIGFAQPVVIKGKLLLRDMMSSSSKCDWDDPLPDCLLTEWDSWVQSLAALESLHIPRQYSCISFRDATRREVHIFSDASKDAIAAVAYLKLYDNASDTSFIMGKAKVAPSRGHTIPRLELCAAVLAVELADNIKDQLEISKDNFFFYSDSQVVLGYINNETRRFYVYVGNRVNRIRISSDPSQWNYVPSEQNPADVATRSVDASDLQQCVWIKGPEFLMTEKPSTPFNCSLVDPENDKEVQPQVTCCKTEQFQCSESVLSTERFSKFSDWEKLVKAVAFLKYVAKSRCSLCSEIPDKYTDPDFLTETKRVIIRAVQKNVYASEICAIREGKSLRNSSLLPLSPILDPDGLIRVGGRLSKVKDCAIIDNTSQHPIIIPKKHHLASLLVRFFHQKVAHQGRHFTEGAVRAAGFWVIGVKRLIATEIHNCVVCRKLRGKLGWQHMADLPEDRVKPSPPFSYVGVDTFGPWPVVYRRTRGGSANQKRWALLFTCLVTRAVHIEVIEELSSSSFINALRRLISIRGPVVQFRSDRGTNFIGATENLSINAQFIEKGQVGAFLSTNGVTWRFNPPHASHMGGAWERLIGVSRKILDSVLLQNQSKNLTHEVLVTLMAEVSAIINNRPLLPISTDPEAPCILSPSTLLTMKTTRDINPFPAFGSKDMLRAHWKYVQGLAEEFWRRWKMEYLQSLQVRRKWHGKQPDLKVGDLVLMKDRDTVRNYWPTGIIEKTFPSDDGKVRKVELSIMRDGKRVTYVRPLSELVTLLEVD